MLKRNILLFVLLLAAVTSLPNLWLPALAQAQEGKSALVVVSNKNFEDTEYKKTRAALEDAGVLVTVAAPQAGTATGWQGSTADVDLTLAEVDVAAFDAVVFIGGQGARDEIVDNPEAQRIAREGLEQGKVVGAICFAPVVLANAGVLDGREATSADAWNAHKILKASGCKLKSSKVVVDGKVVTGNGPKAAAKFGEALVEVLAQ